MEQVDQVSVSEVWNRMRGNDEWVGRDVVKNFGELGDFKGKVTDVDEHHGKPGCRLFYVVYDDGDDAWMEPTEVKSILVPLNTNTTAPAPATVNCFDLLCKSIINYLHIISFWLQAAPVAEAQTTSASADTSSTQANKKQKKKSKYENFEGAPDNACYFLFDVETSGSKRNFDRIIALSFMAHDETGRLLGAFSQKVNTGRRRHYFPLFK